MSNVVIVMNGGKYRVSGVIGEPSGVSGEVNRGITISTSESEGSITLTFDSDSSMMEFGGLVNQAVMQAVKESASKGAK
jgi:hypothetical protein